MTQTIRHCAWCGGVIAAAGGSGRPRRYCRRSHRQRAYEARRAGAARGLAADEAIVGIERLEAQRDARYLLETALSDTRDDLRGDPSPDGVRAAYEALAEAAAEAVRAAVEPTATGSPP